MPGLFDQSVTFFFLAKEKKLSNRYFLGVKGVFLGEHCHEKMKTLHSEQMR